jgi:hypothetical protein
MSKSFFFIMAFGTLVLFPGCEAETPGSGSGGTGGTSGGNNKGCGIENATKACTCDHEGEEVPGRKVCEADLKWGACECGGTTGAGGIAGAGGPVSGMDPELNEGPAVFEWLRTTPTGGTCESGQYEGSFDGMYVPAAIMGFGSLPVAGAVGFDIWESASGEYLEISNGYYRGLALMQFPFEGEFWGKLDCTTGVFEGELRNCFYNVYGTIYHFEGIARSNYDKFNHAFVNGAWAVTEPDINGVYPPPPPIQLNGPLPPLPQLGGVGTWTTTWVP